MSIATLVIGVGGTGVLTLRALKKSYNAMKPDEGQTDPRVPMSLLAFDFDRSALDSGDDDDRFDPLSEDEFFYLNAQQIQDLLRNLGRGNDGEFAWQKVLDWFPDPERVPIPASEVEANGASQLRALGRLGFFLNDELIEGAIRRKLCDVKTEVDTTRLSEEKRVILVSSLAGGTGSGTMIDLAYIARRQEGRPRVYAYLLLPEVFQDIETGGRIFQNTYGTLKELAYLKDQQIPFSADYIKIPPLNILPGGEEPFARLFLCRGSGCSGTDAVKESCIQIAATILPQLQRRIQEKTLAVVSNTLSSNPANERLRRRTHCFSAAGSVYIDLAPIESLSWMAFGKLVELANNPDSKMEWFRGDVAAELRESRGRLVGGTGSESLQEEPSNNLPRRPTGQEIDDKEIGRLVDSWQREVEKEAKKGSDEIITALRQLLEGAEKDALSGTSTAITKAANTISGLETLLTARFRRDLYDSNLELLKNYDVFKQVDERLKDRAKNIVGNLDVTLSIHKTLTSKIVFEKLRDWRNRFSVDFGAPLEKTVTEVEAKQAEKGKTKKALSDLRWWRRYANQDLDAAQHVFSSCDNLKQILADGTLRANLEHILTARSYRVLNDKVDESLSQVDSRLKDPLAIWRGLPDVTSQGKRSVNLPQSLKTRVEEMLRSQSGSILEEARREVKPGDEPIVRQKKLFLLVRRRVDEDPRLRKIRYLIPGDAEEQIIAALVRARQQVFERRTPNPQRKGFGLIMVPEGIFWPKGGKDEFRSFLAASATQVLNARCQIEDYDGSKIWIYFEDLFNPPEHIRNLDEYYRSYQSQEFKEVFHIDRRMLDNPLFRDVNGITSRIVAGCGNQGCQENILGLSTSTHVCPGCRLPIRSRCGNERCTEGALHQQAKGLEKSCPACGEFNHAAWWRCDRHGKVAVEIPIDKERCPRCIEEHLNDRTGYPSAKISVRPDLLTSEPCPRCTDLAEKNPSHCVFLVREDLLPFYRNGVNGHDRDDFLRLADRYKMPDRFRCPNCRTHLIPVHHDQGTRGYWRRIES